MRMLYYFQRGFVEQKLPNPKCAGKQSLDLFVILFDFQGD